MSLFTNLSASGVHDEIKGLRFTTTKQKSKVDWKHAVTKELKHTL